MEKPPVVVESLCARGALDPRHRDHALGGQWNGWRDGHVEPDRLLIHREGVSKLEPGRTGTYADILE